MAAHSKPCLNRRMASHQCPSNGRHCLDKLGYVIIKWLEEELLLAWGAELEAAGFAGEAWGEAACFMPCLSADMVACSTGVCRT